jgi:hypothetical protein
MKKKAEPKPEPIRIYVEYDESATGGEPLSDDEWCQYSDRYKEVSFIRLHREAPKYRFFYDSIELPNEKMLSLNTMYLCVVRYSTGDTFSHTEGCWHMVGVAPTYKIAEVMLENALKGEGYKPWEGYFERLTGTEIHTLEVV